MIKTGTVLDLGSGDGLLLSILKEKNILGTGLDLSEEGVSRANARGLDTKVFDFGNSRLPFPDGSFDTVVMLDILEHLYDPGLVLKEAQRVSKSDVIVGVPNFSSLPSRIQVLFGCVPENNRPKKGHLYWFTLKVLRDLAKQADLREVSLRVNTPWGGVPGIHLLMKVAGHLFPSFFGLSFVMLFRK